MSTAENPPAGGGPTPQELKQALKAFRKRLKLTQLDEESKLGGGPLSHNRARIVAAGFLVKHLFMDWTLGEHYFSEKLLDYDMSNNVGNWQWMAGTGAVAAPSPGGTACSQATCQPSTLCHHAG